MNLSFPYTKLSVDTSLNLHPCTQRRKEILGVHGASSGSGLQLDRVHLRGLAFLLSSDLLPVCFLAFRHLLSDCPLTFLQNSLLRAFSAMDLNGMQGEASQSYA